MIKLKNRIPMLFAILVMWFTSPAYSENGPQLDLDQANRLAKLPLACIQTEYPNKLNQVLESGADLKSPITLHPAFYGCFDWHSAVHGHWSLVKLLKLFPDVEDADEARNKLRENMTAESIAVDIEYMETDKTWERPYGWAWLLKLAEELRTWEDPLARELEAALDPLAQYISGRYIDHLPQLIYPIRVGEHENTAFGLSFAWDYAVALQDQALMDAISARARAYYLDDEDCPINWEPGGYDFLSPCLEEIDLMRRILDAEEFQAWIDRFMPALRSAGFNLPAGEVSDRTDGKLVHLDGLNFSRAWVLYGLARQYPEFAHLNRLADEHVAYSLPNLVGDSYEGGHWLASFALYALSQ